jgi:hypothetical protein
MKILLGAVFHEGERTDMTKLIVAFRKFPNAPKNDMNVGTIRRYRVNIFDAVVFLETPGSFVMGVSLQGRPGSKHFRISM